MLPSVTDNSGVELQAELITPVTNGRYPIGETIVMYRVTDDSGNTANCSFVVTVFGKCKLSVVSQTVHPILVHPHGRYHTRFPTVLNNSESDC